MKKFLAFCLALLLVAPTATAAEDKLLPYESSGWAHVDVMKAIALNIAYGPSGFFWDTREPITRGNFAEQAASLVAVEFGSNLESYLLIMRYRGQAERDANFYLSALEVSKRLGIIQGRGDGDEDSAAYITRQEAAVILARTYRAYQDTLPTALEPLTFSDRGKIAGWALDDVALMNHLGIMTGVGAGRFDPLGSYTIEQCLVSLLRLHEKGPHDGSKQENPFAIPKHEGGFLEIFKESELVFAAETEDYYICAMLRPSNGLGATCYDIRIIDADFSLRSYPTPILSRISERGHTSARPENPSLSKDGKKLFYTATLEEDAYDVWGHTDADKVLIFERGVYTVTMDLATGAQTWTRADLSKTKSSG